jgi:hypothetical protein
VIPGSSTNLSIKFMGPAQGRLAHSLNTILDQHHVDINILSKLNSRQIWIFRRTQSVTSRCLNTLSISNLEPTRQAGRQRSGHFHTGTRNVEQVHEFKSAGGDLVTVPSARVPGGAAGRDRHRSSFQNRSASAPQARTGVRHMRSRGSASCCFIRLLRAAVFERTGIAARSCWRRTNVTSAAKRSSSWLPIRLDLQTHRLSWSIASFALRVLSNGIGSSGEYARLPR